MLLSVWPIGSSVTREVAEADASPEGLESRGLNRAGWDRHRSKGHPLSQPVWFFNRDSDNFLWEMEALGILDFWVDKMWSRS